MRGKSKINSPERAVKSYDDASVLITDFRRNKKEVKMVEVLEATDCISGGSNDVDYESQDEGTNCPASMQQTASIRSKVRNKTPNKSST